MCGGANTCKNNVHVNVSTISTCERVKLHMLTREDSYESSRVIRIWSVLVFVLKYWTLRSWTCDSWEGASDWADRADRADSAQTPRLLQLETENQRWGSNAISDGALSWRLVRLSAKMFHCQSTILRRPAVNTKGNNRTGPAWSGTSAEYKHIVWVCTSIYSTSTYEYGISLHQYLSSSSNALKHGRMLSNAHTVNCFPFFAVFQSLSRNPAENSYTTAIIARDRGPIWLQTNICRSEQSQQELVAASEARRLPIHRVKPNEESFRQSQWK